MRDGNLDEQNPAVPKEDAEDTKEAGLESPKPKEPSPTGPVYDESLFKALYQTFRGRILGSTLLLVLSG